MIRNSPCTGKRNTHEKGKEERFNPRFSPSTNPDKLTGQPGWLYDGNPDSRYSFKSPCLLRSVHTSTIRYF